MADDDSPVDAPQRLERLVQSTELVEERLKEAEFICGQAVYPAVNELRYLGRNLSSLLSMHLKGEYDKVLFEQRLVDAELCCVRANHDITDAVFAILSLEIDSFRRAYGASLIEYHIPSYSRVIANIKEVQRLIIESRGSRKNEREIIYDDIKRNYVDNIIRFYEELMGNADILDEHFRSIQRSQRTNRIFVILSSVAILITVLQFFRIDYEDFRILIKDVLSSTTKIEAPPPTESPPSDKADG